MQGRLVWLAAGGPAQCVLHWTIPAGTSVNVTLANAIFTTLGNLWSANLAAHAATTQSLSKLFLRDLRQASMAEVASTNAAIPGTAVGDELPHSIACVMTIRTASAGRKFRGRAYLSAFAEEANGGSGRISVSTKTSLDAFAAGFITAANQSGATFGVAHRPTLFDDITGLPIAPGLGFTTPATTCEIRDDFWDSQRRRIRAV